MKWLSAGQWLGSFLSAIALADVDNDGDVEILAGDFLYDHTGALLWQAPDVVTTISATAAADLDGDGDIELVMGHRAFHHDGGPVYEVNVLPGFPQIANLDGDPSRRSSSPTRTG